MGVGEGEEAKRKQQRSFGAENGSRSGGQEVLVRLLTLPQISVRRNTSEAPVSPTAKALQSGALGVRGAPGHRAQHA